MTSPSKLNAAATVAGGKLKSAFGAVTGQDSVKANGDLEIEKGDKEYKAAQAEEKAKSVGNEISGQAKDKIGGIFSDDMRNEGKAEQAKASVQDEASKH